MNATFGESPNPSSLVWFQNLVAWMKRRSPDEVAEDTWSNRHVLQPEVVVHKDGGTNGTIRGLCWAAEARRALAVQEVVMKISKSHWITLPHVEEEDDDNDKEEAPKQELNNTKEPTTTTKTATSAATRQYAVWIQQLDQVLSSSSKESNPTVQDDEWMYYSKQDILLAAYVALLRLDSSLSSSSWWQPYWDSLPSSTELLQLLPRHWSLQELDQWLGGSPIRAHVDAQKIMLQHHYNRIVRSSLFQRPEEDDDTRTDGAPIGATIPTFSYQDLDVAMTIVSSRAFSNETTTASPTTTLVPLLDLCNHYRGPRNANVGKSCSYTFQANQVIVQSTHGFQPGTMLSITYGAQSNGQLLLNYGFALADNIEPDGSCNDIYEFVPTRTTTSSNPKRSIIVLRRGPKSYSYGGFVQALETFFPDHQTGKNSLPASTDGMEQHDGNDGMKEEQEEEEDVDDMEDDMEAFLNACDDEEEEHDPELDDHDDHDQLLYGEPSAMDSPHPNQPPPPPQDLQTELQALSAFRERLLELAESYTFPKAQRTLVLSSSLRAKDDHDSRQPNKDSDRPDQDRAYYAALVVDSEVATLRFFAATAQAIAQQLNKHLGDDDSLPPQSKVAKQENDTDHQQQHDKEGTARWDPLHVEELVAAYLKIRHPEIPL